MQGKIIKTPDDFAPNDFAKSCLASPFGGVGKQIVNE
jgi:hypothetical protein